jgi:hypothetical protein
MGLTLISDSFLHIKSCPRGRVVGYALLLLSLLAFGIPARAERREPAAKVCNLFFKSTSVFVGKVATASPYQNAAGEVDDWIYVLKVLKSYRGANQPTISVYTANNPGGLPLQVGKSYLLFATGQPSRLFSISNDGLSGELATSTQVVTDVENVVAAMSGNSGGMVYGRIVYYGGGKQQPLSGIRINILGGKQVYQAVSDRAGWFQVSVPKGKYTARAVDSRWNFNRFDRAWDDADGFRVPNGGCAEIQLRADQRSTQ